MLQEKLGSCEVEDYIFYVNWKASDTFYLRGVYAEERCEVVEGHARVPLRICTRLDPHFLIETCAYLVITLLRDLNTHRSKLTEESLT